MDPNRFKFDAEEFYLKSPQDMRRLFAELPEACDNTIAVAQMCDISFTLGEGRYMPRFPCPPGEDETSWFVRRSSADCGAATPRASPTTRARRRHTRPRSSSGRGMPGTSSSSPTSSPGPRTTASGSDRDVGPAPARYCAYALRITDLDPVRHGLIFERFLNPERPSMPDFDVDFDERRRGEVIRYVTEKYGDDRVAQIVTYGTIKAKQAVKDAARVMGHPFAMGEKLTKAMPAAVMGKDVPLAKIYDQEHDRRGRGRRLPDPSRDRPAGQGGRRDGALGLEGLKRQWGVHAAGVIMSSEPLVDVIPIMKREQDGQIITQFDYPSCEALGLVKMDFLGLRNLTILDDAIANVAANRGVVIDLDELSQDPSDAAVYELLQRGDTLGVFQLDGAACAPCCGRCSRTTSRTSPPPSRCTAPARWAPTATRTTPSARPAGRRSNRSTRAGRTARRDPRPDLRAHRLPGAGPAHRAEGRGLLLGKADMLRKAMGRRRRRCSTPSSSRSARGCGRTATPTRRCGPSGTSSSRSPTTPSTRRTPRHTGWSATGRHTSRRTIRPSTWPRC